jgi:hypothetical protein
MRQGRAEQAPQVATRATRPGSPQSVALHLPLPEQGREPLMYLTTHRLLGQPCARGANGFVHGPAHMRPVEDPGRVGEVPRRQEQPPRAGARGIEDAKRQETASHDLSCDWD